MKKKVADGRDR